MGKIHRIHRKLTSADAARLVLMLCVLFVFCVFLLGPLAMLLSKAFQNRDGAFVGFAQFQKYLTSANMLQTFCPDDEKLLIVENGAYGRRMAQQAALAGKNFSVLSFDLCRAIDPQQVRLRLEQEPDIGTVMFVHSETTSGVINPLRELAQMVKGSGRTVLVDAMGMSAAVHTGTLAVADLSATAFFAR